MNIYNMYKYVEAMIWMNKMEDLKRFLTETTIIDGSEHENKIILKAAILSDNLEVVRLLMTFKNLSEEAKNQFLHYANERNNSKMIQLLIEGGANINCQDKHGLTILHIAAKRGRLEIVEILLQEQNNSINVDMQDRYGYTPLMYAAKFSGPEVVRLLIEKGANVNIINGLYSTTALKCAIEVNSTEIAKILIENGSNIEEDYCNKKTALHYAVKYGRLEMVKLLIDSGAEINALSKFEGCGPFNPNGDNGNFTPLHYASARGHLEMVEALIENGADISIKNSKGYTAIDEASNNGHSEIVKLLST